MDILIKIGAIVITTVAVIGLLYLIIQWIRYGKSFGFFYQSSTDGDQGMIKFNCPQCGHSATKNYLDVPMFRTSKVLCKECNFVFVSGDWSDISTLIDENKEITFV